MQNMQDTLSYMPHFKKNDCEKIDSDFLGKKNLFQSKMFSAFVFHFLPCFSSCKFVTHCGRLNPFPRYECEFCVLFSMNAANANAASTQHAHSLSIIVSCQSNLDKAIICLMPNIELIWVPLIGLWGGKREGGMGLEKTTVLPTLSDGNSHKIVFQTWSWAKALCILMSMRRSVTFYINKVTKETMSSNRSNR